MNWNSIETQYMLALFAIEMGMFGVLKHRRVNSISNDGGVNHNLVQQAVLFQGFEGSVESSSVVMTLQLISDFLLRQGPSFKQHSLKNTFAATGAPELVFP